MAAEAGSAAAAAAAADAAPASAAGAAAPAPTTEGPSSADKKGPRGSANMGKKKPSINTAVVDKAQKPEEEQADALLKKKRESQLKRQSMPEQLKQTLSDMKEKNAGK